MNRTHENDSVVDVRNLQMIQLRVTWKCDNFFFLKYFLKNIKLMYF